MENRRMTEEEQMAYLEQMNREFHRMGRILLSVAIVALLGFPFAIAAIGGGGIDWRGFLWGFANVAVIYYPVALVEFLAFSPMVGVGGSYLTFLTGNLTNLKIPNVMNARDITKVEQGTPENEIVSTIAVATSALVTMLVILLGVLALVPLTPILQSPVLQPAFDNVVAALFGALGLKYFLKQPKIAVLPMVLMTALCILVPSMIEQTSILLIPSGLMALGIGYVLNKRGQLR